MKSILPEHLDLIQKADLGCEIKGKWPVNQLHRLSELLFNGTGEMHAELTLGRITKLRFISGHVSANVKMTCQRCMQPVSLVLEVDIKLGLITNEDHADRLPEAYEPCLVNDGDSSLIELLEDELLLVLPLVAVHDHDCSDYLHEQKKRQKTEEENKSEKENPFSVLKDLL